MDCNCVSLWETTETHTFLPLFTAPEPFGRLTRQLDSSTNQEN